MDNFTTPEQILRADGEDEEEDDDDEGSIFERTYVRNIFICLYTVVFLFCFFGNLIVVLVTALHKRMRSVTKFCLSNLAFANLCVGVFCVYQNLCLYLYTDWKFGSFFCKMYHFINGICHTATILIHIVISVERYLVILHPFRSRRIITTRRLWIILAGVWVLSAILSLPRLFFMGLVNHWLKNGEDGQPVYQIACVPYSASFDFKLAEMIYFVFLFLVPVLTMTFTYTKVALYLRARSYSSTNLVEDSGSTPTAAGNKSSTAGNVDEEEGEEEEEILEVLEGEGDIESQRARIPAAGAKSLPENPRNSKNSRIRSFKESLLKKRSSSLRKGKEEKGGSSSRVKTGKGPRNNLGNHSSASWSLRCKDGTTGVRIVLCTNQVNSHSSAIRMLIVIVLTFTLCNFPFHLRKLYQNYVIGPREDLPELLVPVTFLLMYLNCAINPLLYGFMSSNFRTCCQELFRCRK